jgi:hypothetical protein
VRVLVDLGGNAVYTDTDLSLKEFVDYIMQPEPFTVWWYNADGVRCEETALLMEPPRFVRTDS